MKRTSADWAALLLRIAVGLIFLPHGWSKVFGAGGPAAFAHDLPGYGIPAFLGYIAAWAELLAAPLLILGFLVRLDALLLACVMGVAVFVVQLPDALNDVAAGTPRLFAALLGTELPLSLFAACLALAFLGAGRFSLDALLRVDERLMWWRR
ncbi:MAG TPA: DoxX family protein [Thermoanaerobaculia bacterium]|nr:DoxX family protein [Thermoanaerobaculia bacterium]